jgi:hypothetical protein
LQKTRLPLAAAGLATPHAWAAASVRITSMNMPNFLKFPPRPANMPKDAARFWPMVEVVSFVGLVTKPIALAFIALVWWAHLSFDLSIELGIVLSTVASLLMLVLALPALVGLYWDAQILEAEERAARAARRATRQAARRGEALSAEASL